MITIDTEVDLKNDRFSMDIDGHAYYAEVGKDIVCAAVSVLIETLVDRLDDVTDSYHVEITDGKIKRIGASGTEALKVLATILTGLELIQNTYPENVKVTTLPISEN